jgi:hypothetical protein
VLDQPDKFRGQPVGNRSHAFFHERNGLGIGQEPRLDTPFHCLAAYEWQGKFLTRKDLSSRKIHNQLTMFGAVS